MGQYYSHQVDIPQEMNYGANCNQVDNKVRGRVPSNIKSLLNLISR